LHRIMTPDGSTRQSRTIRWLRTLGYGLISLSGLLLLLSPLFPADNIGRIGNIMAWFIMVGGAIACAGSATSRWFGEFIGLPLLVSAFLVFSILTIYDFDTAPYIVVANIALLVGLSMLLTARWRYVFAIYRVADKFSREGNRGS
jgi:hypothetical protein